jgi:transcriptional regulator with XRE-family HTH domain
VTYNYYVVLDLSTLRNNFLLQGNRMTPAQLRMARSALKIGVRDLAALAGVTTATITRFENERGGLNAATQDKLQTALEKKGIEFFNGTGVKLVSK